MTSTHGRQDASRDNEPSNVALPVWKLDKRRKSRWRKGAKEGNPTVDLYRLGLLTRLPFRALDRPEEETRYHLTCLHASQSFEQTAVGMTRSGKPPVRGKNLRAGILGGHRLPTCFLNFTVSPAHKSNGAISSTVVYKRIVPVFYLSLPKHAIHSPLAKQGHGILLLMGRILQKMGGQSSPTLR
jgi:hypothetical protein